MSSGTEVQQQRPLRGMIAPACRSSAPFQDRNAGVQVRPVPGRPPVEPVAPQPRLTAPVPSRASAETLLVRHVTGEPVPVQGLATVARGPSVTARLTKKPAPQERDGRLASLRGGLTAPTQLPLLRLADGPLVASAAYAPARPRPRPRFSSRLAPAPGPANAPAWLLVGA